MEALDMHLSDAVRKLEGRTLASVEFVRDYVQFRFDGPQLTAYVWPVIQRGLELLGRKTMGYCDMVVEQVGKELTESRVTQNDVQLSFADGTTFSISLRERDYQGPEALEFRDENKGVWIA